MLPEEQELNRLESEQADLEDQVTNEELILETIKLETAQFSYHYYQTVGLLYAEHDRIKAHIAWAEAGLNPDDVEAKARAEAAEHQAEKSEEEAGITEKQAPPPPEITPEIKQAFRQAAKLMHPDRATTDAERDRRNVIMALVNVAYAKGDQVAIEKLILEFGHDPEAIIVGDIGSRLVKAFRRIAQLRRRLNEVQEEIAEQKNNELYELFVTVTETKAMGGDPLSDLTQQILQEISELKIELETIRQRNVTNADKT